MIQGYFLSVLFLLLSSLLYYQNRYRLELSFLLRFTEKLKRDRRVLYLFFSLGLLTSLVLFFFPISPGPFILGDLIPFLLVLYNTLYFFIDIKRQEKNENQLYVSAQKEKRRIFLARLSLIVALLHFVFPSLVLL